MAELNNDYMDKPTAETLANEVLDGYGCNGRTIREWIFLILQLIDGDVPVDLIDRIEYRKKLNEYYERTPKSHQKTVLDLIEMLESMQSKLSREFIANKEREVDG